MFVAVLSSVLIILHAFGAGLNCVSIIRLAPLPVPDGRTARNSVLHYLRGSGPAGLSRLSNLDHTTGVRIRYVRDCPGELVYIVTSNPGQGPDGGGWRIHERQNAGPRQGVGYEYIHSMVDDHSRFTDTEALTPRTPPPAPGSCPEPPQAFAVRGYCIKRVMTDLTQFIRYYNHQ